MNWLILVLGIAANASASVLVKLAVMPPMKVSDVEYPMAVLTNWPFWLGLWLYGAAFLLYAAVLSRLPFNVTHYPVLTAEAVTAVALWSVLILREPFHCTKRSGILLMFAGIALITD